MLQGRSGRFREETILTPLPGIDPRHVCCPAICLFTVPTELPCSPFAVNYCLLQIVRYLITALLWTQASFAVRLSTTQTYEMTGRTDRQTDRQQTGRQTDGQTDGQTADRQTD